MLKFIAIRAAVGAAVALLTIAPAKDVEAQTAMRVLPGTARAYPNEAGQLQVDALVQFQPQGGELRTVRAGVAGCKDGAGVIGQVGQDGAPLGGIAPWSAGGTKVADALALAICQAAGVPFDLKRGGVQI